MSYTLWVRVRAFPLTAALGFALASTVAAQEPSRWEPLVSKKLTIMDGDIKPGHHEHMPNGDEVDVPDVCQVIFSLPRGVGKSAIAWEKQGDPSVDADGKKCHQAYNVGTPESVGVQPHVVRAAPRDGGQTWHLTEFEYYVQWVDPVNGRVSAMNAGATSSWYDGGLYCMTLSGGIWQPTYLWQTGWFDEGSWGVGYVDSCTVGGYTGNDIHVNATFPGCNALLGQIAAYVFYEPHSVYIDSNGLVYGYSNTTVGGGACVSLLSRNPINGVLSRYDAY
jgi:hypothetical protein